MGHHPDNGYRSRKLALAVFFGGLLFGAFLKGGPGLGELSMGLVGLYVGYVGGNASVKVLAGRTSAKASEVLGDAK